MFTQDFWLSAAWGRMIAAGVNPYHTLFTPESLAGLPLDHFPMPMSYGPLWGLVSAGVMLIAGDSVLVAAVLFKAVIAVAWIGSLHLVYRLTGGLVAEPALPRHRRVRLDARGRVAVACRGPQRHRHGGAGPALAVPAHARPEAGADRAGRVGAVQVRDRAAVPDRCAVRTAAREDRAGAATRCDSLLPAALGLATMALFYRSPEFFDGVRLVGTWYFLQPRDAVQAVELALGLPLLPLALAVTALFPAYAAYATWTAWSEPTTERLLQAALAVMSCVMFTAVSHLWAWYVIWALALAALLPCVVAVALHHRRGRHVAVHAGLLVDRAVRESPRGGGVRDVCLCNSLDGRHAAGSPRLTTGGGGRACIGTLSLQDVLARGPHGAAAGRSRIRDGRRRRRSRG